MMMRIPSEGVLILDGATGTELERRGVDTGLPLWSAGAILDAPEVLLDIHSEYLRAGSGAIIANTFRTHQRSLAKSGLGSQAESITAEAVRIACRARDSVNPDALVFGSVAPLEDCYSPELTPDMETCQREHGQIIGHLLDAGVDLVLIETMCSSREAIAAAKAAEVSGSGQWGISFCLSGEGRPGVLLDGTPICDLVDHLQGAAFIGINCVSASVLDSHVGHVRGLFHDSMPIAAYGNVGHVHEEKGWVNTDVILPRRYADLAMEWIDAGACIVGGCCGTTPETIRAIKDRLPGSSTT